MPENKYQPKLIIDGAGQERFGLDVHQGFVRGLHQADPEAPWATIAYLPPKLLTFLDAFMSVHYHLLDNRYGIAPKEDTPQGQGMTYGDTDGKPDTPE